MVKAQVVAALMGRILRSLALRPLPPTVQKGRGSSEGTGWRVQNVTRAQRHAGPSAHIRSHDENAAVVLEIYTSARGRCHSSVAQQVEAHAVVIRRIERVRAESIAHCGRLTIGRFPQVRVE